MLDVVLSQSAHLGALVSKLVSKLTLQLINYVLSVPQAFEGVSQIFISDPVDIQHTGYA